MEENYIIDSCGIKRSASYVFCSFCEKQFLKLNKNIKRSKNSVFFCSLECCQNKSKSLNIEMFCAFCKESFFRKPSKIRKVKHGLYFCSVLCRNKAQSIDGIAEFTPDHYGTSLRGKCRECGERTGSRTVYCKKHKLSFTYEEYILKWKNGVLTGNQKNNEDLHWRVRRYMFEKYNSECQKCGWCEVHPLTGKVPLTVNHIDGDSSNSREENLELICPNCHSLTPNYGALNKGKGRSTRARKLRQS